MRPAHYTKLPDGMLCKCLNLWREWDGSHWCCGAAPTPPIARPAIRPAYIRLTDWIREGDLVTYTTGGRGDYFQGPSDCQWLVPGTVRAF